MGQATTATDQGQEHLAGTATDAQTQVAEMTLVTTFVVDTPARFLEIPLDFPQEHIQPLVLHGALVEVHQAVAAPLVVAHAQGLALRFGHGVGDLVAIAQRLLGSQNRDRLRQSQTANPLQCIPEDLLLGGQLLGIADMLPLAATTFVRHNAGWSHPLGRGRNQRPNSPDQVVALDLGYLGHHLIPGHRLGHKHHSPLSKSYRVGNAISLGGQGRDLQRQEIPRFNGIRKAGRDRMFH
jgi:hypothetical protein